MVCSNLVGTIGKVQKLFNESDGEKFYLRNLTINTGETVKEIPVVASEYLIAEDAKELRYEICCYIRTAKPGILPHTYIYVCTAEEVTPEVADCDLVTLSGYIKQMSGPNIIDATGETVFTINVQYKSYGAHKNWVMCVAHEKLARKYKDTAQAYDLVNVTGNINVDHPNIRVDIETLDVAMRGGNYK